MKFYFDCGLPRSGSTLLTALLNQNPNIEEFIFSNNLENKINLSGSGSSLFIYYEEESDIDKIIKKIPRNWRLFFCKPLQYSPICNIN